MTFSNGEKNGFCTWYVVIFDSRRLIVRIFGQHGYKKLAGNVDDVDVQQWIEEARAAFLPFEHRDWLSWAGVDLMPELQRRVEEEEAAKMATPAEDFGDKAREELLALWTEGHIDEAEFLRRSADLEEDLAKGQVATTAAIDVDNDVIVGGEVSATAVDSNKVGCESDAKDKVDSSHGTARERSATIEAKVPTKAKATKLPKEEAKAIAKAVLQEKDQHGADAVAQPKSEKVRRSFLSSFCRLTFL
jgi:hypothetical protein